MWRKSLQSSAIYSTDSRIENLKMCVSLKTINSLLKLEKFHLKTSHGYNPLDEGSFSTTRSHKSAKSKDVDDQGGDDTSRQFDSLNQTDDDDSSPTTTEVIELEWQQKVFSRYEIEYYKDLQNCTTDLQKEYHKRIVRDNLFESETKNDHHKIFTYVDADMFVPQLLENAYPKPVSEQESTIRAEKHSHPYAKSKVMYIYADLNPDTLLFMLRWLETEQMLIIYPDFNEFDKNPYFIEIDSDYRHFYSYAVQNISTSFQATETAPPLIKSPFKSKFSVHGKHNISQLLKKPPDLKEAPPAMLQLYDMAPEKYVRVIFLFNIKQAEDFEYNSLHVRYHIALPKFAKQHSKLDKDSGELVIEPNIIVEEGSLSGTTHSSKYKWDFTPDACCTERKEKCWNFSFSFQLSLLVLEEELCQQPQQTIHIYFELISIDSWTRERCEGFCDQSVPIVASASRRFRCRCYRPDYGWKDRVERFFIGGRRLFDFKRFNEIDCDDGFLNRFRTKCVSTGTLEFHSECLVQRNRDDFGQATLDYEWDADRKSAMTLDDIMRAFHEARQRLEATTLSVRPDDAEEAEEVQSP